MIVTEYIPSLLDEWQDYLSEGRDIELCAAAAKEIRDLRERIKELEKR